MSIVSIMFFYSGSKTRKRAGFGFHEGAPLEPVVPAQAGTHAALEISPSYGSWPAPRRREKRDSCQPLRHLLASLFLLASLAFPSAHAAHAVAQFGQPKYPAGFTHFDYVNPGAPKGGRLALSVVSQNSGFDKFNPFSLKGRVAPGALELMFETLTTYSLDELNTQYGLLADDIRVAPDFGSAIFRLNARARFSNGDPVTAEDVRHSWQVLSSKQASPRFQSYFAVIKDVVVLDARTVRFEFTRKGRDLSFIAGSLPVFSPKWGLRSDGTRTPFAELGLEAPIASGPYLIERSKSQSVIYRRNPDYWGSDIPVRRGSFNFDRISFTLYQDAHAQMAGLRAGEYDFFNEGRMFYWRTMYFGGRFDNGELLKVVVPHKVPPAMNGYVLNLRHERFRDWRVRAALNYAFDYEWQNDRIFSGRFKRMNSYFANTPLAATGLPRPEELELLNPYRNELSPEVFGPMFEQPDTHAPSSMRDSFAKALALFAEAGWHNRDGVLRNAKGEPFVLEVALTSRKQGPTSDGIYANMEKLGIQVRRKLSDTATNRRRLNNFDFDYTSLSLRESRSPGDELWRVFNSADADVPGSENIIGVKSPAIDALIKKLLDAGSQQELETTARALDRVLVHGHYFIPWRYLPDYYLIHHHRLQRPERLPDFYNPQDWAITTWWEDANARLVPPKTVAQRGGEDR